MRRREFIAILGVTATLFPCAVRAQRAGGGIRKLGVLMAGSENADENRPRIAAFRQALAELGWRDGDNIRIEYRWSTGKNELIRQYAEELVALAPDVILANSTPVITMLKRMTASIPVVFALNMDPVGHGHVQSLSRPGGNFTGFTFVDPELVGKWMVLLRDVAGGITRAAVLFGPAMVATYDRFARELAAVRQEGAIELVTMHVGNDREMETAIKAFAQNPGGGLLIGPDPFNQVRLKHIAQLAAESRLPTVSVYRPFVADGGLMAYGPNTADIFRRSAGYVDRILKGARPADLPVQQPDTFEFSINLKTARALGLSIPPSVLALADEVIE
jgi:putative ABC transport system substrate-binding protein